MTCVLLHIHRIKGIHSRNQIQAKKKKDLAINFYYHKRFTKKERKKNEINSKIISQSYLVHHLAYQPSVLHEIHYNAFYVLIQIASFVLKINKINKQGLFFFESNHDYSMQSNLVRQVTFFVHHLDQLQHVHDDDDQMILMNLLN